jgi:hypothetical protein
MDFATVLLQDTRCNPSPGWRLSLDERTRLFLCVLASVGFFAVLAGLFGALTGVITWRGGRAAGTLLGLSVARSFARLSERGLSKAAWGALVGGTDGAVFGAAVGTLVGLIAGWYGRAEWDTLRPVLLASLLLVTAAVLFGLAAIGLTIAGTRAILGLFVGSMAGASEGLLLGGADGLLIGVLAGGIAGTVLFLVFRSRREEK